ncbi:hypothetical protein BT93_L5430 [Corymbia citriodora subsp. variegata]|uniref:Uncharacterized protein n=1 Tax=Corymbia citriodora subsp. variegata TaxID=360336 RepID=A0A8T0CWG1_CORYI|nr:hypothetical protein BT93_L5430 [Corymbia citriodora subsp. variegata]
MEDHKCRLSPTTWTIFILNLICILSNSPADGAIAGADTSSSLSTYVIEVRKPTDKHLATIEDLETFYRSFLPATTAGSNQEQRMVHSYRHVLSGFAAKLTAEEAKAIGEKDGVLDVRRETVLSLHTTHTPNYLGLRRGVGLWEDSNYGKGVIIGLLDTGIFPDHLSFSDEGVPPPPAKWKGRCNFNRTSCNNKLIGARSFTDTDSSSSAAAPYDDVGHGTHTASTAAGAFVKDASVFGLANGTAAGIAPLAHLAVYKICTVDGRCADSAILAGFDAAIEDGVDVLSVSLGYEVPPQLPSDLVARGAFAATQKGIFVSCSVGNNGPYSNTISNGAPWVLTVGASSTDRTIKATVRLGNGQEFDGETLYQPRDFEPAQHPLAYPEREYAPGKVNVGDFDLGYDRVEIGRHVKDAGGVAMILANVPDLGYTTYSDPDVLPAAHVSYEAGTEIKKYIKTASAPTAAILFKGTQFNGSFAPAVAFFSSRGPNSISPGILKPDIIGPGLNILAGWISPTDDKRAFNVFSGTSMSCPHLSGVVALLKSAHPDWSPAAIKSAILTTAATSNAKGQPIVDEARRPGSIFATGAGHVNVSKAVDPGLIYDTELIDYVPYLCGLNYSDKDVSLIVQKKVSCSRIESVPDYQLNYPSITVDFERLGSNVSVKRTVRNVGPANSRYKSVIEPITGIGSIHVSPRELVFTKANQTISYTVNFTRKASTKAVNAQGAITWVSAQHSVRTAVAVLSKESGGL